MTETTLITNPDTRVLRVKVPATRDPFVNTPLIHVKCDARGVEWFWTSTWNSTSGTTAVLVSERGEHRIYRFPPRHAGFYSAIAVDDDTLWLCGMLDRVVRLTLSTGEWEEYPTGAPEALVFQGMAYDPATGKLFAAAFPWNGRTTAFSFDTRSRRGVRVYEEISPAHYMRRSFPNGDGTYSVTLECPEDALLIWDPQRETLVDSGVDACDYHTVVDDAGRHYFPAQGWYDPRTRAFTDGPRPAREACWFARAGALALGIAENGEIVGWDWTTGATTTRAVIPDRPSPNLTASGKLVAVNMYGVFYRFSLDGALELTRVLPTDSVGQVDCLCRIDDERLLGTPFITQRFWEVNLRTGAGVDCGRAAPGSGEVLRTWKLGGKIYMAAYTGGELVEYDPALPARFPANPRTVADPPGGMRPVADTHDGRRLFYACSAEYGHLGSTLASYDTVTGEACYAINPLPAQQIISLAYCAADNTLLCGTTNAADCHSCPPTAATGMFATIDADTLAVLASAPASGPRAGILGPLDDRRWIAWHIGDDGAQWFPLDPAAFAVPAAGQPFPAGQRHWAYAGTPGRVLFLIDDRVELWDLRAMTCLETLATGYQGYQLIVQDGSLYLLQQDEVIILEGVLAV